MTRASGDITKAIKSLIRHCVPLLPLSRLDATALKLPGVLGVLVLVSSYNKPRPGPFIFAADSKVTGDLNCKHLAWSTRLVITSGRPKIFWRQPKFKQIFGLFTFINIFYSIYITWYTIFGYTIMS